MIRNHVDVLIPTYNHEEYIADCVESVLNQSHRQVTAHVFNDCSTDGTYQILETLKNKWGRRIVIYTSEYRQGSGGKSVLHNKPKLRGEFWAVVEGDDYWVDYEKLTKQIALLRKYPRATAAATACEMHDETSGKISKICPDVSEWNYLDLVMNSKYLRFYCHISTILWRNSHSPKGTPWPRAYKRRIIRTGFGGEIYLLHSVLQQTKGSLIYLDAITAVYRHTGKGIWSSLNDIEKTEKNENLNKDLCKSITPANRLRALLLKNKKPMLVKISRMIRFRPIQNIYSQFLED